ncbi:MAG: radical SAM protein, partial [Deltaproteobacteria bacterium]|nr:radical SAM protein [Deltaproteobacteria bacterium]MBW2572595.1 radical SAM protein [Deltaproteobacteria bacterium]
KTLDTARKIGITAGLKYVYTGNVPGERGEKTFCSQCGEILIDRWGFYVQKNRITNGMCPQCGAAVDGVWV